MQEIVSRFTAWQLNIKTIDTLFMHERQRALCDVETERDWL